MGTGPAETARPVLLFLPYFYIPLAPALKPVFAHIVVKIRKRPALNSIFARIVAKSRRGTGGRVKFYISEGYSFPWNFRPLRSVLKYDLER